MRKRRITVRSGEELRKIVRKYEQSGLGPKKFCEEEGYSLSSLLGWRKKFGKSRMKLRRSSFAEISPEVIRPSSEVALHFPSGLILKIGG